MADGQQATGIIDPIHTRIILGENPENHHELGNAAESCAEDLMPIFEGAANGINDLKSQALSIKIQMDLIKQVPRCFDINVSDAEGNDPAVYDPMDVTLIIAENERGLFVAHPEWEISATKDLFVGNDIEFIPAEELEDDYRSTLIPLENFMQNAEDGRFEDGSDFAVDRLNMIGNDAGVYEESLACETERVAAMLGVLQSDGQHNNIESEPLQVCDQTMKLRQGTFFNITNKQKAAVIAALSL